MPIIDWIMADPANHVLVLVLLLLAVWLFWRAVSSARLRRGRKCGQPLKRGSDHFFCRNPQPDPGERCAAGHRRPWPFEGFVYAILVLLAALGVQVAHPIPPLF